MRDDVRFASVVITLLLMCNSHAFSQNSTTGVGVLEYRADNVSPATVPVDGTVTIELTLTNSSKEIVVLDKHVLDEHSCRNTWDSEVRFVRNGKVEFVPVNTCVDGDFLDPINEDSFISLYPGWSIHRDYVLDLAEYSPSITPGEYSIDFSLESNRNGFDFTSKKVREMRPWYGSVRSNAVSITVIENSDSKSKQKD